MPRQKVIEYSWVIYGADDAATQERIYNHVVVNGRWLRSQPGVTRVILTKNEISDKYPNIGETL